LNAADRKQHFLTGIETYITAKNLGTTKFSPEFAVAETLTMDQLNNITQDECFNYAYHLYQYADHVGTERAQCENVVRWCKHNVGAIIAVAVNDAAYGWGTYDKYETKVALILRNDDLAGKINEWLMTAEARLETIKSREYNIRRKADILIEKGKRK
jgi:hypothetical protein